MNNIAQAIKAEREQRKPVTITLSPSLADKSLSWAKQHKVSRSGLIRYLLTQFFESQDDARV